MLQIYVGHSTAYDYVGELYDPLLDSEMAKRAVFVLPHKNKSDALFDSKKAFVEGKIDIFLAEVSYPSMGLGIELGWADVYNVPIFALYKQGFKYSSSIFSLVDMVYDYSNLVETVSDVLYENKYF